MRKRATLDQVVRRDELAIAHLRASQGRTAEARAIFARHNVQHAAVEINSTKPTQR